MSQPWFCAACGSTPAAPWPDGGRTGLASTKPDFDVPDELRPVTALFADVVGSTSLGERLDPAEVKVLIGECVTRMTRAVESYGGVVRSYMGDGIAAFFGIDGAREDDAIRAALAGLQILDVIAEYAGEIHAAWNIPSVMVRAGMNSGRVATGLVGSAQPHHVALGDAINVAARLQGLAEPGSIVVGAATATQLASRFELERLGRLEIRGRAEAVEGWKLLRYVGEPRVGHLSSFVGRLGELDVLDGVLDDVRLGRGRIVLVVGEPGIGKSRLVSECYSRAASDVTWLSGRCAHQRVLRPYGPFVEMLSHWLEIDSETPHVVTRVRLLARLRESLGDDATTVLPFLSQLLAVEAVEEERNHPGTLANERGEALRQAYASWIAALADVGPVVVAVDDVERADASTRLLLDELYRLTSSIPLVVLLAIRDDPDAVGWDARVDALTHHSRKTVEVRLCALAEDDAEEFIALKDPHGLITPAMRCELRLRAEGNPLYLEELTRTALEAIEDSSSVPAGDCSELELPAALENLLLARIDRVSARARMVLQIAAAIGRRFPMWILEKTASRLDLRQNLEILLREGLIQEDGLTPSRYFAFRHGLYQEAALATLTPERRCQLHETIANALEGGSRDQALEEIAGHYLASGNKVKALEYLERAARRAASLSSLIEAVELTDQALDLSKTAPSAEVAGRLKVLAGQLATQMGQYNEAVGRWQDVLSVAPDDIERARALLEIARTEFELGDSHAASAACERGLAIESDSAIRRDLLLVRAAIELRLDLLERAKNTLAQAESVPGPFPTRSKVRWLSLLAGYHASTGELHQAEHCAAKAVQLVKVLGDLSLELRAKRDMGMVGFLQGKLQFARETLSEVCDLALAGGDVLRAQEAAANLVTVQLHLGNLTHGLETGLEALGWVQAPLWRSVVLSNLGEIETELGRLTARDRLMECMAISDGDSIAAAFATLRLADISLAEGDVSTALTATVTVADAYADRGRPDVRANACVGVARAALAAERFDFAMEYVRRAQDVLHQTDRTERPPVLRVTGHAYLCLGQHDAGVEALMNAREEARDMSMRLDEARALVLLGMADSSSRRRYFHEARELFVECGCVRGLAELRTAVASTRST